MLKNRLSYVLALFFLALVLAMPAQAQDDMPVDDAAGFTSSETITTAMDPAAAPEKKLGFPQLDASTYASQVFWLLVSFVLLYTLMSKIALPRVGSVIDMRQQQRDGNLSRAEDMSAEAEKMKIAYEASLTAAREQASDVLTQASEEISDKNSAETGRFGEHARNRVAAAEQAIARAKKEALASLADISAEIAADMVQKIAAVTVAKPDAKKVVTSVMEKQ
jgi:F-type H+-transporting ATPase subunit b